MCVSIVIYEYFTEFSPVFMKHVYGKGCQFIMNIAVYGPTCVSSPQMATYENGRIWKKCVKVGLIHKLGSLNI